MKKLNVFLPAILLVWVAGANAHGPVRQKLSESIKIDAAPGAVWERIKDFGSVSWLPMVESTDAQGGNKKGATRVLTFKEGGTISEELKKHDVKKMSYAYKITDMSTVKTILHSGEDAPIKMLPVTDFAASIKVKASGKGSEVTWKTGYYRGYMNNNPPEALNEAAALIAVQAVFRAGLENLKALAESKQPVKATRKASKKSTSSKPANNNNTSTSNRPNKTAFDPNYPAANFEPKVIYIDKSLAKKSSATSRKAKVVFDPKYPAAYFEPKVIYP